MRKKKNKAERAYSRAGEGDDERAADEWNEEWVKEFWADFIKELSKNGKRD
jgi:hypothetical protein